MHGEDEVLMSSATEYCREKEKKIEPFMIFRVLGKRRLGICAVNDAVLSTPARRRMPTALNRCFNLGPLDNEVPYPLAQCRLAEFASKIVAQRKERCLY